MSAEKKRLDDLVDTVTSPDTTQLSALKQLRQEMGLNDPFYVQLWHYLSGLAQGDLGKSLLTSRPVMDDIMQALPATFELVLVTIEFGKITDNLFVIFNRQGRIINVDFSADLV